MTDKDKIDELLAAIAEKQRRGEIADAETAMLREAFEKLQPEET